jgi:hypothetical protein
LNLTFRNSQKMRFDHLFGRGATEGFQSTIGSELTARKQWAIRILPVWPGL